MTPVLNTIVIYARNMRKTAEFYCHLFDFKSSLTVAEGLISLESRNGGASILVLQAAKSVKLGQVGVKAQLRRQRRRSIQSPSAGAWREVWSDAFS